MGDGGVPCLPIERGEMASMPVEQAFDIDMKKHVHDKRGHGTQIERR